jgi:hypothetical protein
MERMCILGGKLTHGFGLCSVSRDGRLKGQTERAGKSWSISILLAHLILHFEFIRSLSSTDIMSSHWKFNDIFRSIEEGNIL